MQIKLNVIRSTVEGKRVVLIDDSIVRGTTAARIVSLLKEAGATEVHMRLAAPPFMHPCYFGTDIDSTENLIAAGPQRGGDVRDHRRGQPGLHARGMPGQAGRRRGLRLLQGLLYRRVSRAIPNGAAAKDKFEDVPSARR